MARLHVPLYPISMPGYWTNWKYYTSSRSIYFQTLQDDYEYCKLPAEFRARFSSIECVVYNGRTMPWCAAALHVTIILLGVIFAGLVIAYPIYFGHCTRILCRLGCLRRRPVARRTWPGQGHIPMTRPASGGLAGLRGELEPRPYDDQMYVELYRERERWAREPQRVKLVWNPNLKWPALKAGVREWALDLERLRRRITGRGRGDDGGSRV